jgi:lactoylglutathione lyase
MTRTPALNLLVVRCQDLEASRRFYCALGLPLKTEQHGAGPVHYSCQLRETVLELYPARARVSCVRLGFTVPDVRVAVASVRSLGASVDREPTADDETAVVRDPDNNHVDLSPA